jgi:hypothetical protein
MAANTTPIFPLTAHISWINAAGLVANTTTDLTSGTNYASNFTAGVNGSRVDFIRARALGTNAPTVLRIWLNNGSTTGTASNQTLFFERTLPNSTSSQTAEIPDVLIPINTAIPAGYTFYYTFGTAVAAGYAVSVIGGDY